MENLIRLEARKFLQSKKVLIFDDKRVVRNLVKEALVECGVKQQNIISEKSMHHARKIVEEEKPEIIISEFQVGDDYGLDLANLQMQLIDDQTKKIFIIITADATQSTVADAAEEEIEAFLVSPVSKEKIVEYINKAVKKKVNPSAYASMVYEAKRLIKEKQFDVAKQTLMMAKIMHDRPMMACYLTGEIHRLQGHYEAAMNEFNEGLSHNPIHYRCLLGKFLTLRDTKRKREAFMCLETISSHFPLTPDLLKNAFILAITSYRFEEVENYYKLYTKQDRKTNELKITVSQALLTAGKILLRERRYPKRAFDYFKKGAIISGRKKAYLAQVLETLCNEGYESKVKEFIGLFEHDDINSALLNQFRFKAFAKIEFKKEDKIIDRGRKLIYDGQADEEVYMTVCQLLQKNNKPKLLESIVYKGIEDFPEIKNRLLGFLPAA
ncbi:MAG: response regulator [Bdellovibrionales bacterium]|nr:response regulator [Bdellovibrionales bacterium]